MAEPLEDIHGYVGNLTRRVAALEAAMDLAAPDWRKPATPPAPVTDPALNVSGGYWSKSYDAEAEGQRQLRQADIASGAVVSSGGTVVSSGGNPWLAETPVLS